MAIRIVRHNPDGGIEAWHDELAHGGTLVAADLRFARNADGSVNADFLEVTCPVAGCAAVSVHPVGGGCQPGQVQKLFLRHLIRRSSLTFAAAKTRVRDRVLAMDGPGRFRLARMTTENDDPDE